MNKETVLLTWVHLGIKEFYLSFEIESRWITYSIFFCHQGLEKICKAYYLGECSLRWENLIDVPALKEINKIAKTLGHDIPRFVKCMQSRGTLPPYRPIRPYSEDDLLECLQAAYIEARYPVPQPFYLRMDHQCKERFRISIASYKIYHDLLGETAPRDYARSMARALLKKIESEFSVKIQDSNPFNGIADENWNRFANVFFRV